MYSRKASHAGSWYIEEGSKLNHQLSGWLKTAKESGIQHMPAKAIIAPHAGFAYSGPTAAYAYIQIDTEKINRVFLLGPSHHVGLDGCGLFNAVECETPLYNIPVDIDTVAELRSTGAFSDMNRRCDEDEHSLEMHMPYIAKVMEARKGSYKLVPILVGSISSAREQEYADILAPYFSDPQSLFVISSDFCHWGRRFDYTFYKPEWGEIYQSVEKLDKMGMDIIEELDSKKFRSYLSEYRNTICGRNPISILLGLVSKFRSQAGNHKMSMKFVSYAQSSHCKTKSDSSVSYASASLIFE